MWAITRNMWRNLHASVRRGEGQTLVEYALIVALLSVALIAALIFLAGGVGNVYNFISGTLTNTAS